MVADQIPNLQAAHAITVTIAPERLRRVGPLVPGVWSHPILGESGREVRGEFLLDTGAYGAMIDRDVADSLVLPQRGMKRVQGIHGSGRLPQYQAQLILPTENVDGMRSVFTMMLDCVGIPSLRQKNLEHEVEIIGILGRQFLAATHMTIDGSTGNIIIRIQPDQNTHEPSWR